MTITVEQKLSNILRNLHRNSPHPEADPGDIEAAIAAITRAMTPPDTAVILDFERRRLAEVAKDAALYSGCPAEEIADEIRDAVLAAGDDMAAGQRRVRALLLEANNRYLERAREAEAKLRKLNDGLRDALIEHLGQELACAYDCSRVWEAWSVGAMSADDFSEVNDRLAEIVDGILTFIHLDNPQGGFAIPENLQATVAEMLDDPECQRIVGDPIAIRVQSPPILWCTHVRGPDDVIAAGSYEQALQRADEINAEFAKLPRAENAPRISAVPAIWPWTSEAHLAALQPDEVTS